MIPPVCHFVWLGNRFPWLNALAVVSATKVGGFDRVVLHTDDALATAPHVDPLRALRGFELRRIDLRRLARRAGEDESRVSALYANMTSAAARSDVLRTLILAVEGGVYLDVDTVTVAPFTALRAQRAFVGQEVICFPDWGTRRHSTTEIARAYGLAALRSAFRMLPRGHQWFARTQHLYALAPNNAVLGAEAGHPFLRSYLARMLAMPPDVARRRFAVGPDLLGRVCNEMRTSGPALLPPSYFYPLGPVISEHWWRRSHSPALEDVLAAETVAVHWYASVRSRKLAARVNADYVRRHRDHQLFSKLAARYLDAF